MVKNKLKSIDIYGYKISLNIDNSGDNFNTNIGGFITLILFLQMLAIFSIDLSKLVNHK